MLHFERYIKQIMLKDFGVQSQVKLHDAKVLVIGAGGLGCPVLSSLNAMGVGTLGYIDYDVVSESNLHRQFLYQYQDIGMSKVAVITKRLALQNPSTTLFPIHEKLTVSNALHIIKNYDIVVDATDNFESRYMINDACVLLDKPLIYGSVFAHQGQVAVFNVLHKEYKTTYRDAFSIVPKSNEIPNCEEAGVLGIYPTIIGSFQANEVVKLITGSGNSLIHTLLTIDLLNMIFYPIEITPTENKFTLTKHDFLQKDYYLNCSI